MENIYNLNQPQRLSTSAKKTVVLSVVLLALLAVTLTVSLSFKTKWLWMDEVLSYILISDPSVAHMNSAVVSGMDANPPLFANVYWFIGHLFSLDTQFLRGVSIVLFALTIAIFFNYTTTLIGTPIQNFLLIISIVSFTYLNLSLSTQMRTYALFLLIGCLYFMVLHKLILTPNRARWLITHVVLGTCLVYTHNFGLFYLAASGAFFGGLWLWSKDRNYLLVVATHALILLIWFVSWYPSFAIQAEAGKPHSWIPLPTFATFFTIVGELAPTLSSKLERTTLFFWLPMLRFGLIIGLFVYISLPKLKTGFQSVREDKAFLFYQLSGFIYVTTILIALVVTFVHTSIFISRYLWPSHLLVIYQLMYAYYFFAGDRISRVTPLTRLIPVYVVCLVAFIFYQNRKMAAFSGDVLPYLAPLDKRYPVFVETADYFLPIWFHKLDPQVRYLLDWQTAATKGNYINATVEHKILKSVRENYGVTEVVPKEAFNKANFPHFYVVDETSQYQIEHFIKNGQVNVVRELPMAIPGHRILECVF